MTHAARAHARFAPSAAHRWVNCTASVALCETVPNKSTPAADEGTAAHMLAEWCLNQGHDPADFGWDHIAVRDDVKIPITEEMVEGVQVYLDYVRAIMDQCETFAIEAKLDLREIHPDCFGTGDFIGYDEQNQRLHIVDFKFGRNFVASDNNWQGIAYAIGGVKRYQGRKIEDVYITIVQPRTKPSIRTWTVGKRELLDAASILAAAAVGADNDPEFVAGDWCGYCPAAAICPTARDKAHEIARAEFGPRGMVLPDVAKITRKALGAILSEIDQLEDWCKRVKGFAFEEACNGRVPPGHKLVAKRAVRKWKTEAGALSFLHHQVGIPEDELYTKKFVSPAQAEKLLGKDDKKALAKVWEKVSSGIKLVSENDPGEPIAPEAAAELSKVEIDE